MDGRVVSYITRDLLSFALSRNAGEQVVLYIKTYEANGDGSYRPYVKDVKALARVVDLQPREIQRLQEKGITLHRGVSVSIPLEYPTQPDKIVRADGTVLKVMDYTISENGSVFIADAPALGPAVVGQ